MVRTSMRGLLLCLANLALLPGCQHFPTLWPSKEPAQPAPLYQAKQENPQTQQTAKATSLPPETAPVKRINLFPDSSQEQPLDPPQPLSVAKLPDKTETGAHQVVAFQGDPPLPKKAEPREFAPLVKALQCILDERHPEALQHLKPYDEETQQFFLRLLPPLTILVRKNLSELTPPEAAVLSDQLYGLLATLRPRSELGINKMCYCKKIRAFGYYDPLPNDHAFLAGSNHLPGEVVQLYVELKNFASEKTAEGDYLTKLACALELRDLSGKVVWSYQYDRKETTQRRKARLNDLHGNYSFYVPALPPGAYQLTLQIADETTPELRPRVVSKSLDFRVTPINAQAGTR